MINFHQRKIVLSIFHFSVISIGTARTQGIQRPPSMRNCCTTEAANVQYLWNDTFEDIVGTCKSPRQSAAVNKNIEQSNNHFIYFYISHAIPVSNDTKAKNKTNYETKDDAFQIEIY